uniref:NADH-ubiquinone oxidoreductase chain 2 n=1 Tax=Dinorhynchus dybowskyi TaxID=2082689 RepID=A0A3G1NH54_9HEMI|nr:NADH dehydrogenase subunit 2 [Dinorhynchus dybowskyi]AVA07532.1 NADH dehydrogenase subunit 2 [Dinorhynchus dybowskyi]
MMIIIMSTMITLSSNNWISMWIGLEINMMSFIPLILSEVNKSSSEAAMIYFLTQSVSSMLLMAMILTTMCKYLIWGETINSIISFSIFIKLGVAPFHMWMPKMMNKMSWMKCSLLMTWQKIAPMYMLSNMASTAINYLAIILSIIVGSVGGLNQTSLRKMMAYSSINHLGWMLAISKSMNLWMIYLLIYSSMISSMCYIFFYYKINFINQLSVNNMNNTEKVGMFIMMMSMGGLPPFIGFLPKWIVIQSLINENEILIILIMIMFSLITLMYYLRIMTNMFLSFNLMIKWSFNHYNYFMIMIMTINLSLPMIMIMDIM